MNEKVAEVNKELSALVQQQGNNQRIILSVEASNKIKELRDQEVEAAKRQRGTGSVICVRIFAR